MLKLSILFNSIKNKYSKSISVTKEQENDKEYLNSLNEIESNLKQLLRVIKK